ncbi:glycoside hydrolase family 27 protein [Novosphingobium sp. 9]|uniref:glycoside hydrolase family 27 protein n=1 Tax=Novosphingobium sp. 9 TaxID=2025349 RepID=UPI0021B554AA|nr:glycoside hydrolase family 27 protein [Novosphingobium sp. 9]
MRSTLLAFCALIGATFAPAAVQAQATPDAFAGSWIFDGAPSYPGVTMMQVSDDGGHLAGTVTTAWYGAMPMADVHRQGDTLSFTMRNINDAKAPTQVWTARLAGGGVHLKGKIWSTEHEEDGRRGTAEEAAARTFHATELPQAHVLAPNGLAKTPPMGWSSWNAFADHIDDATVRAMADYLVSSGLRDAGYRYVNIDDGWQGERDASGVLQPNSRFPDMKALADYVHARGLKLGIYSSQGPKTCAGYPGSYGHVEQDARTFAGWGVDYLKYDLCSGEWFYADRDTVLRSYYEMGAALRATRRDILYSLCEYGRFDVGEWGVSVGGNLWRTTGDITDTWGDMARIGFDHNGKPEWAGPGHWNDPDMLEIGNGGMKATEYRTHMTLWAMSAAPLLMGQDLRKTTPEALAILSNRAVIAVDQDRLGIQGHAVRKDGTSEVWSKPLADGSVAVALFNRGDAPTRITLAATDAGRPRLTSIRDLWTGKSASSSATGFMVPAHGSVLLKVR